MLATANGIDHHGTLAVQMNFAKSSTGGVIRKTIQRALASALAIAA
jgi:hypothetical protein